MKHAQERMRSQGRAEALRLVPAVKQETGLAQVEPQQALVPALEPKRMERLIPRRVTRREKTVGREIAYRLAVQRGYELLHQHGAEAINRMHDHTHQCIVQGVVSMNSRVRAVADPQDQAEIAEITLEQKAIYKRHQFGILEAAAFGVAKELDRSLYQERRGGLTELVDKVIGD